MKLKNRDNPSLHYLHYLYITHTYWQKKHRRARPGEADARSPGCQRAFQPSVSLDGSTCAIPRYTQHTQALPLSSRLYWRDINKTHPVARESCWPHTRRLCTHPARRICLRRCISTLVRDLDGSEDELRAIELLLGGFQLALIHELASLVHHAPRVLGAGLLRSTVV